MTWNSLKFIESLDVDREIAPDDQMFHSGSADHYYYVGLSDLLVLLNALNARAAYPGGARDIERILDFGCGHGRVARCIRAAFPDAEISVTDLIPSGVRWCVERYGCKDLGTSIEENYFDVIWAGSVFTHLPEHAALTLLRQLRTSLRAGGVLVFTSQGRFSITRLDGIVNGREEDSSYARYNLPHSAVISVLEGYRSGGYGYSDYPGQSNYGVSCVEPSWYARHLSEENAPIIQILLQEKGADNHQDVQAFMRAGLLDAGKGPLWEQGSRMAANAAVGSAEAPAEMAKAESYIEDLYLHLLQRKPNNEEKTHWINVLLFHENERQVFYRFVQSPEYLNKFSSKCYYQDGHFYSPVVNPALVQDYVRNVSRSVDVIEAAQFPGIGINEGRMTRFWADHSSIIGKTPYKETPSDEARYHYNATFPYGDAIMLRAMIAANRPARVIEIGSGFSSGCTLDAAEEFCLDDFHLTCIEPYPERLHSILKPADDKKVTLKQEIVQNIPVAEFERLGPNDILFIDSTHVLKTGSDVHYELFSILPALKPGVLVHFHDILYPFEYPLEWIRDNYSWNEIYGVRAFLMYNDNFDIEFFNSMFCHRHRQLVEQTIPIMLKNPGGSLWLRKVK